MIDYIANHPTLDFWIQVGNEPDRASGAYTTSATDALNRFLDCLRNEIPKYRPGGYRPLANLRWMAAMPMYVGSNDPAAPCCDLSYLDTLLNNSELVQGYDALGVTAYGDDTLFQQFPIGTPNGDLRAGRVLDRVLAHTNRPVFVTEAGVNSTVPWWNPATNDGKIRYYLEAMYRMPSRARGFTIYTLTRKSSECYSPGHFAVDTAYDPSCTPDTSYPGSVRIDQR